MTRRQLQTLVDVLARARVREVFAPTPGARLEGEVEAAPQQLERIVRAGYAAGDSSEGIVELQRTAR